MSQKPVEPVKVPRPRMNKTEAEYGRILEAQKQRGEIIEYAFEPFSLMYGDNAFYKPDWVARVSGELTIEQVGRLCRLHVIDLTADPSLYQDLIKLGREDKPFRIIEVKGGRIFPEAFPRFKAAKLRHQWATFELHQKIKEGWRQLL